MANLEYTEIRSPEDGIVIERKVDPGQTVAAQLQTPELFTIAPEMDKHVYVYASVDEADIGQIRRAKEQGRVVKFTVNAYPGDLFDGNIFEIRMNSTTTQNVVTYPVIIEAKNPNMKLMPGMTANISFQIETKENVLRLPAAALRFMPQPSQVRPEDRQLVELPTSSSEGDLETHSQRKGRAVPQEPPAARLGARRTVAPGYPSHPWVDGKPIRGNTGRRPQRRPGRRDRDGKAPPHEGGDW